MSSEKLWSLRRLGKFLAEVCEYAVDNYRDDNRELQEGGTPWPDDNPNHTVAWSCLGPVAFVLSCYVAQHWAAGKGGVEADPLFEALRMYEFMPRATRRSLAEAYLTDGFNIPKEHT